MKRFLVFVIFSFACPSVFAADCGSISNDNVDAFINGRQADGTLSQKLQQFLSLGSAAEYERVLANAPECEGDENYNMDKGFGLRGSRIRSRPSTCRAIVNVLRCYQRQGWPLSTDGGMKTISPPQSTQQSASRPSSINSAEQKDFDTLKQLFSGMCRNQSPSFDAQCVDMAQRFVRSIRDRENCAATGKGNEWCRYADSLNARLLPPTDRMPPNVKKLLDIVETNNTPPKERSRPDWQTTEPGKCPKEIGAIITCKMEPRQGWFSTLDGNQMRCTNTYSYAWTVRTCSIRATTCYNQTIGPMNNKVADTYPGDENKRRIDGAAFCE